MKAKKNKSSISPGSSGVKSLRRPAAATPPSTRKPASMDAPEVDDDGDQVSNDEAEALATKLTRQQRSDFQKALSKDDIPQAIRDDLKAIDARGYGLNKRDAKNLKIAAWVIAGWAHPVYKAVIKIAETKEKKEKATSVGWIRMCAIMGGETQALR
eukprot:7482433-Pyramimonas_sp.AAC.1